MSTARGARRDIEILLYRGPEEEALQKASNLRVRGEQSVGVMTKTMRGGLKMSGSGRRRITAVIGRLNLGYNLARDEQILGLKLAGAA